MVYCPAVTDMPTQVRDAVSDHLHLLVDTLSPRPSRLTSWPLKSSHSARTFLLLVLLKMMKASVSLLRDFKRACSKSMLVRAGQTWEGQVKLGCHRKP
jgi:hypothetical protein